VVRPRRRQQLDSKDLQLKDYLGFVGGLAGIGYAFGWVLLSRFYGYFGITPEQAGISMPWVVVRVAVVFGLVGLADFVVAAWVSADSVPLVSIIAGIGFFLSELVAASWQSGTPLEVSALVGLYVGVLGFGLFWFAAAIHGKSEWQLAGSISAGALIVAFVLGTPVGRAMGNAVADGSMRRLRPLIAHERATVVAAPQGSGLATGTCVVILGDLGDTMYIYSHALGQTVRLSSSGLVLALKPESGCDY
jgi:hypothetical protein